MKNYHTNKGQAIVVFALVLVGILGFVGFAVDGGMMITEKSKSQATTDAISITAAQSLIENNFNFSSAINAAVSQATNEGFNNNGTDNIVAVTINGPYTENGATVYYINSNITSEVSTTFAQLFINNEIKQSTHTQVRLQVISGNGPMFDGFGLLALDGDLTYPLAFDGSGTVYSDGANIYSSSGIKVPGGTKIYTEGGNIMVEGDFFFDGSGPFKTDGGDILVLGNFDHGNGTSYINGGNLYVNGDIIDYEGAIYGGGGGVYTNGDLNLTWSGHMYEMAVVNAAGSINPPSQWFNMSSYVQWATPIGGLPTISISPSLPTVPTLPKPDCSGLPNYGNFVASSYLNETIYPGYYTGIRKGGSGTLTLSPGLYCISGDVILNGGTSVIANEVLFYINNGNFNAIEGTNLIQTAPGNLIDASGNDWAGMAVFLDPDTTSTLNVNGGASASFSGTFYAPESVCNWNNGVQPTINESQLVCGSINITGGVTVRLEYNEDVIYQGGNGTPIITLEIVD